MRQPIRSWHAGKRLMEGVCPSKGSPMGVNHSAISGSHLSEAYIKTETMRSDCFYWRLKHEPARLKVKPALICEKHKAPVADSGVLWQMPIEFYGAGQILKTIQSSATIGQPELAQFREDG
ncbi:hypothetical protein NFI96_030691 [Prochilodus magdalenae]|nr:hypothetical protein NFI96_030691 [Prochilodus magdalenae]